MKDRWKNGQIDDQLYVELVRSVYSLLLPAVVMSVGFVVSMIVVGYALKQSGFFLLAAAGAASSLLRLLISYVDAAGASDPRVSQAQMRRFEIRFAVAYYQFAILLGASAALIALLPREAFGMLAVCLTTGYAAGAAVSVGLRPAIAIPSMIIAVFPTIGVAVLRGDPLYAMTAVMMTAFLIGGCRSVIQRHRATRTDIVNRLTFQALSRYDGLTELPNRLRLGEWYDEKPSSSWGPLVAVYCLDLNDFKLVNDSHGHPIGDVLLRIVARRLAGCLRSDDIAARLGGDEFVVGQRGIQSRSDAEAFANRLVKTIAAPYAIEGRTLAISTSVGIVVAPTGSANLERMLSTADDALYHAKRTRRATVLSSLGPHAKPSLAA